MNIKARSLQDTPESVMPKLGRKQRPNGYVMSEGENARAGPRGTRIASPMSIRLLVLEKRREKNSRPQQMLQGIDSRKVGRTIQAPPSRALIFRHRMP